ncbi:hypothetical protein [Kribbella sp. CA-293567]|uniref:hypothetical protein n=1 Tax=Kribbella sp. CA-293567 TaxID=3002436 RepID=UPI0022DD100B|nr:hypothetical protein [Kribbella sp. CA-293567]WBQ07515.1 hypothetical protein OX958_12085 [Kribbella sp. CA-293567]
MADQTGPARSLDQAAADGSLADARHRAVDPVPIVVADVTDGADLATLDTADGEPPAPIWRVRRKLSPRPVPGNRRRKPPAQAPVADEEPTLAEEMDDVATHPDKAAETAGAEKAVTPQDVRAEDTSTPAATGARSTTATATKSAKPKTAAEIVAEQKAREKAAAEAKQDETTVTKPVARQPAAPSTAATAGSTAPKQPVAKPAAATAKKPVSSSGADKGKAALSAVGSGVKRFRNLLASLIWLIAVIAAAVLALGALFTALDQANQSNEIVKWVLERGHDLVGPFKDLFRLETAKNTLLVNWGIAALVYLVIGKLAERFVRP